MEINNPLKIISFYLARGKKLEQIPRCPMTKPYFDWLESTEELPAGYSFTPSNEIVPRFEDGMKEFNLIDLTKAMAKETRRVGIEMAHGRL